MDNVKKDLLTLPENQKTGILLSAQDIKLHRKWFKEMCKLQGITTVYYTPKDSYKHYTGNGELDTYYNAPIIVQGIYEQSVNQYTMRKRGWNSELQESISVLHVPYDLEGLQAGCLFVLPTGIDNAEGRLFKVIRMFTGPVYPASVAVELGPVIQSTAQPSQILDHSHRNFTLLAEEEEDEN